MGKIIGIDLGTTNSCVAVFEGNEPVVIEMCIRDRFTTLQIGSFGIVSFWKRYRDGIEFEKRFSFSYN